MKKTTLKNGLTVITNHDGNAKATMLTYWVKVGGNNEKNYPYGIAHFTEHMLFKGTKNRTSEEINESIDGIGGNFNASTSAERTNYFTQVPFTGWEVATEVLSDMLFYSTFPIDEMEKEKKVVTEEIKRYEDDPGSQAYDLMMDELMKHYPERKNILGTRESVASITQEDLNRFVNEFYQPSNMVFVATGNINHEMLCEKLEALTPKNSKSVIYEVEPFVPYELGGKTVSLEKDIKQAHLRWMLFAPTGHDKDAHVFDLVGTLLGGSMSSRLFKIIREEKGLAYTANAGYAGGNSMGMLIGYVGTDVANLEDVKTTIIEQLERLKTEPVSEKELSKVKSLKSGRLLMAQDYKESINRDLAMKHLFELGEDVMEYTKKINAITAEDIMRVANTYFGEKKVLFAQIVPKKEA
mgnify:CR=1 FL=1